MCRRLQVRIFYKWCNHGVTYPDEIPQPPPDLYRGCLQEALLALPTVPAAAQ
ncbi:hypothetical protein DICSQDRAFT_174457 [Dichomitus squalens LYAD-421 SS1]|uniref:Uncharacterized protein n=1 Tax=Dichomitus squalens (strain LYAD-421) TaxID=732165 RepID=R7SL55_DICSQ|nr:uncharacterized protein DICSQDRAFT_174457 [Dichomitus squalens LYAD-421 SS1]EJF56869.1 hypothetical protein DICSQDRAFT_174457 [Dichomitus squalens LYAD-421 SS1]